MSDRNLPFSTPVSTVGLAGFPDSLSSVAQARRAVEDARLPVVRSRHAWLDVANALVMAEAARSPALIEAARAALCLAVAVERRGTRVATSVRPWAIAA
ncbi:hypothetical protein [Methylobacterium sp. WL6]|uniref:hypothetical protein n=1 Tax=Methylobacterium sp. WL6 TaxID=2603901 RepID=UPI0011CABE59|nr:hypothetical protein [Methylobacterium sp. WL6]TXN70467.1 hypothetical protein FV230_10445 [Methylobacterium sp. WL6]